MNVHIQPGIWQKCLYIAPTLSGNEQYFCLVLFTGKTMSQNIIGHWRRWFYWFLINPQGSCCNGLEYYQY